MPEITERCVSTAWLKAIRLANACPRKEVSNLVVNIEELPEVGNLEDWALRSVLDQALEVNINFSVSIVASTIFPVSLWRRNLPRSALFDRYLKLWPRINKIRQNRRGTYFQRLISYLLPDFWYYFLGITSFTYLHTRFNWGASGIVRAVVSTALMLSISTLLTKMKLRLQL